MQSEFLLSYAEHPEKQVSAYLVRRWDQVPDTTEAPTFRNMAASLFSLHGVTAVALFVVLGAPMFLVRGPHWWLDVSGQMVKITRVD